MRRSAVLAVAVAVFVLIPAAAFGAQPEVFDEGEFDDTFVIPGGVGVCDFDVEVHDVGSFQDKGFFNQDGSLNHVKVKVRGSSLWTGPGGTASENYAWNGVFDPETETFTQNGNVFNIHAGPGGVLVNDSGKIVIDTITGEAVRINGPHQAWDDEFGDLCAAIG
jgi:hypothetical protein